MGRMVASVVTSARVVVVGGGIVAASCAYHLALRGVEVVVVDDDHAGAATAAGAGIICPWRAHADDARYRLSAAGARYYPQLVALLAADGETETGYATVGALCVAPDASALQPLADRLRARRESTPEIGDITDLQPGEPARLFPPLAPNLAAVLVSGGGRVDGRAITASMLRAAVRHGAVTIRGTATLDQAGQQVRGVLVGADRVRADVVVVAAGAWTAQVCAGFGAELPIGPQRGQIVHACMAGTDTSSWPAVLPAGDPYLLAFPGGRVVFGATREHAGFDYRTTIGGIGGLLPAALAVAPGLGAATMLETRVGFRPVTQDGWPLLGWLTDGLVVAAGNGAEGLTAGPVTGRAAAALALGEKPAGYLAAFDPMRFQAAARF